MVYLSRLCRWAKTVDFGFKQLATQKKRHPLLCRTKEGSAASARRLTGQGFLPARTERDNEGLVRFRPRKTPPPNRREQQQGLTAERRFVSGREYAAKRESRLVTAQVLRPLAERSDS